VGPQPQDVPVEGVVLAHRLVREAAHFGEIEHAGAQPAGHGPSAFRTEVERQEVGIHREGLCAYAPGPPLANAVPRPRTHFAVRNAPPGGVVGARRATGSPRREAGPTGAAPFRPAK